MICIDKCYRLVVSLRLRSLCFHLSVSLRLLPLYLCRRCSIWDSYNRVYHHLTRYITLRARCCQGDDVNKSHEGASLGAAAAENLLLYAAAFVQWYNYSLTFCVCTCKQTWLLLRTDRCREGRLSRQVSMVLLQFLSLYIPTFHIFLTSRIHTSFGQYIAAWKVFCAET